MSWFILIFIAVNLFSFVNLFDKFFCEKRFKNIYSFAVTVNLLSFIFITGLIFFSPLSFSWGWPLFFALLSGPVYFVMWLLWWKSLANFEVSRVAAIFNTRPIFTALLAVLFLGESLTNLKWLAILFIVIGAIICSWDSKKDKTVFDLTYFLIILSALLAALGDLFSKFALKEINPFTVYLLSYYATLPLFITLLFKKGVIQELKINLSNKKTFLVFLTRVFISFISICFFYLALASGPISFVIAITGGGPLLVFIYATLISLFWPKVIKEELTKSVLIAKALAIILIVGGVVLINL